VDDTLSEPLAIHGMPDRDARVLAMLDAVGLARGSGSACRISCRAGSASAWRSPAR
jgi:hypothetical protein